MNKEYFYIDKNRLSYDLILQEGRQLTAHAINADVCVFRFEDDADLLWTAVFYDVLGQEYKVVVTAGEATVPAEAIANKGVIALGLYGVDTDRIVTTNLLEFRVHDAPTGEGVTPNEYEASIYTQLLKNYGDLLYRLQVNEAQIQANVTASTDADADYAAEVVNARVATDGTTYPSLGDHLRRTEDVVNDCVDRLGGLTFRVVDGILTVTYDDGT